MILSSVTDKMWTALFLESAMQTYKYIAPVKKTLLTIFIYINYTYDIMNLWAILEYKNNWSIRDHMYSSPNYSN